MHISAKVRKWMRNLQVTVLRDIRREILIRRGRGRRWCLLTGATLTLRLGGRFKKLLKSHRSLSFIKNVLRGRGTTVTVEDAIDVAVWAGPMGEVELPATIWLVADRGGGVPTEGEGLLH